MGNQLLFLALLLINQKSPAECPVFNKNNTEITIIEPDHGFRVSVQDNADLRSLRILIYDFENAEYFYDSWRREKVHYSDSLNFSCSSGTITVTGLQPGDYAIMIEKAGCRIKPIGLGFSGFPNSAIKID